MTRDEGISLIHQTLGFRSDQTANIVTNMLLAQINLELSPNPPWFLLSEDLTTNLTVDDRRVAVPDGFMKEYEKGALFYIPTDTTLDEVQLVKDDFDTLFKEYGSTAEGEPEKYSLDGDYFNVFPKPDDVYEVRMKCYLKDDTLSSNIENAWLREVPLLLLGEAGLLLAPGLRDAEATATFRDWRSKGMLLLQNRTEAREHENRLYQMGGDV